MYKVNYGPNGQPIKDLRDVNMEDWGTPQVSKYASPLMSGAFGNVSDAPIRGQLLRTPPATDLQGGVGRILNRASEPAFFNPKSYQDDMLSQLLAHAGRTPGFPSKSPLPPPIQALKGLK